MNGASAEYVTITEPSLDAPRLTTMLVQARAIEPHPQRIARANAATDRRGLDMRNLLVGSSVRFPGPLQHTAWPGSGEASRIDKAPGTTHGARCHLAPFVIIDMDRSKAPVLEESNHVHIHCPLPMMPNVTLERARRLADGLLLLLMVAAAFLLGCHELYDADVWWHLRSGQWIWSHGRLPALDPFTFASADRPWIDLHWLFQLMVAGSYALGGVRGILLATSAVCGCVVLAGLTSRDRRWPMWMVVPCWLPALIVLSDRFDPRPELLSLMAMAAYLTVLKRVGRWPVLAWALPVVQALWVNAHALFILGPIILGAYLVDQLAGSMGRLPSAAVGETTSRRWWIHMGGATIAVAAVCLMGPYGLRGALFPLELIPKITNDNDIYKKYIIEFKDLSELVRQRGQDVTGSYYFRAECFLLWALPLALIVPAIWREKCRTASAARGAHAGRALTALGAFGLATGLVLACVLGFPGQDAGSGIFWLGRLAPLGLVVLGALVAAFLAESSRNARLLAGLGGAAVAGWAIWLRAYLLGLEPGPFGWLGISVPGLNVVGCGTALLGVAVAGLTLRAGGRLFDMVLVTVFGFLGLRAIRNMSLFGLVAGFVLTCNLGEWAGELAAQVSSRWPRRSAVAGLAARIALIGVVGLMIFTIVSGQFYRAPRVRRRFGLGESPQVYAHEAARFAGRPGLPSRALVFDLRQAGVYLFHNGPGRKPFIDGRLEVPSRETFATYIRLETMLNQGRNGWAEPLRRMGDPLILLDHVKECGAEGTLITDPGWRCVYFDPVASVFVSRSQRDIEASYPSVDFAARHFQDSQWRAVPPVPWGLAEGKALLDLESVVQSRHGIIKSLDFALMLLVFDRLVQALAVDPTVASRWTMLGTSCWNMVPDSISAPPGPDEPWELARGLLQAQATYCYRRAGARSR